MAIVLFKTTLLFVLALGCLPFLRRASSVIRHLICACAMAGALLLPLTMLAPPQAAPIRLAPVTLLATSTAVPGGTAWPVSGLLVALWLAVMAVFLLRLAIGYRRIAMILRKATPAEGYVLSDVAVPMVAGLVRPVILMPRAAESWPLSQRAAALKHELAHVERKDLWTSLIAHLACAVYWFHPLVWAVARRQRREQETACDDAVLCSGFEPASYAEALIATARQITSTNLIGCHMTQKTLKSRIARLFENGMPRMSSPATLRRIAICFAAIAVVIALVNGNPNVRAAQEQLVAQPAPPQPASSPASTPTNPAVENAKQPAVAAATNDDKPGPADHPYKIGEGITPPRVLDKVDPAYTEEARAAKISGPVLLSIVVGTDGLAHDINVVTGLDSGLDLNAVAAVQQWHFRPGTKDGEPVPVQAQIEVNFRLQ
jgi:TonB family protein